MSTESNLNPPVSTPPERSPIRAISMRGLFGYQDASLELADGQLTLLYGTNGAGKSTTLRLIQQLLGDSLVALSNEPVQWVEAEFVDGGRYSFDRATMQWREVAPDGQARAELVENPQIPLDDPAFLRWIEMCTPFRVHNGNVLFGGANLSREQFRRLLTHYESLSPPRRPSPMPRETFVAILGKRGRTIGQELTDSADSRRYTRHCTFIQSDRLSQLPSSVTGRASRRIPIHSAGSTRTYSEDVPAVIELRDNLQEVIRSAREKSRRVSQEIDGGFFRRAIDAVEARRSLPEEDRDALRSNLNSLHARLRSCSLATSDLGLPEARSLSGEASAILDVYLEDLLKKALATEDVLKKLELFLEILNTHLLDKRAILDPASGTLRIIRGVNERTGVDDSIELDRLSSGEQHLLVLFFELLFAAQPGGLCLIDEPEISLNVDWQRRFVDTLLKVAELVPQQFIIATHSPVIVGEHEALLRSLEAIHHAD